MNFSESFYRRLEALPERETHTFPRSALPDRHRTAAVLLPFWRDDCDSVRVAFTLRSQHMPTHAGQVSFPGGGSGPGEPLDQTALREAFEELGIEPTSVCIMGRLDDAWSVAGHHVVPYVSWLNAPPRFRPNPSEVDEVLVADVELLMRPESSCEHRVSDNGVTRTTQAYRWDGGYVWGLTADILLELFLWVEGKPSNRAHLRLKRLQSRAPEAR
jgi:8-oxo-dGTP pyrophosphatase MutT (NUDIX family)